MTVSRKASHKTRRNREEKLDTRHNRLACGKYGRGCDEHNTFKYGIGEQDNSY